MEITTQQTAAASTTAASSTDTSSGLESDITADFETFLTLLTAQLRNQDPLQPVDSTEFIAQLASFSAVEQQTRTNDLLEEIRDGSTGGIETQAASWLGQQVSAPGPVSFDGATPVEVTLTPLEGSNQATLTITNDFGLTVRTLPLDPSLTTYSWGGQDATGTLSPAGRYTLTATYFSGETEIAETVASSFATVSEVRFNGGSTELILDTGATVAPEDVGALRVPADAE
ncbi:MAG: flagellar hook capping FlgD N-terminal domain-containing protein [Pseudomonadota bacterium]